MVGPWKGALKRFTFQKSSSSHDVPQSINSRSRCDFPQSQPFSSRKRFRLPDEEFPTNTTMEKVEEYNQEVDSLETEMNMFDPQQGENVALTSHGSSLTRKESRAL